MQTDYTSVVTYINQQGQTAFTPSVQAGTSNLALGKMLSLMAVYITGHLNIGEGAGAEARGVHMADVRPGGSGLVCLHGVNPLSPLVFSHSSSSSGAVCHGTDVPKAASVLLSPDRSTPRSSGEGNIGSPILANPSLVCGFSNPVKGSTWEIPTRRDHLSQVCGKVFHPRPEIWKLWLLPLSGNAHILYCISYIILYIICSYILVSELKL